MSSLNTRLEKLEKQNGTNHVVIVHAPRIGREPNEATLRQMARLYYGRSDFDVLPFTCGPNNGPSFAWIDDFRAFVDAIGNRGRRIGDGKPSTCDPDRNSLAEIIAEHLTREPSAPIDEEKAHVA